MRDMANDTSLTSRWRRNRSTANLLQVTQATPPPQEPSISKAQPKLERAPSKMSLFNLFSRPKVEKARGHTEAGLDVPVPVQPEVRPVPQSRPKSSLRLNPAPTVPQVVRSRSSQMLRPLSLKPTPIAKSQSGTWDPPPLFQAHTQAIKHATVQSCVFSPDILLRTQSQRKQNEILRERNDSVRDLSITLEQGTEGKLHKLDKSHKRLISNSVLHAPAPQLVNKIYVLTTSGHVLQYTAEGSLDRLPEKVLKLGKDSAAFACDLIPGKHWVLQISQSAKEDGTVTIGPKPSLLSRLRSQNAPVRKTATSFLLVLESAEEMDSWMTAVRKEIDNFGTTKSQPESTKESAKESIRESSSLEEVPETETLDRQSQDTIPSHRVLAGRDPNRLSRIKPIDSPFQSQYSGSPKIVTSDWEGNQNERPLSVADTASIHSSGPAGKRTSIGASSIATTAVSQEQLQLDQLRERSRYSFVSTATSVSGTGTRSSSRNASPSPSSPHRAGFSFTEVEPFRSASSLKSFQNAKRRSFQQPLPTTNENSAASSVTSLTPQRHSIYGPTSPTIRQPEQELNFNKETISPPLPLPTPPTQPSTSQLAPMLCKTTPNNVRHSTYVPTRYGVRSSSAPPNRQGALSPPPRDPAPPPARRQSTMVNLPSTATLNPPATRRLSQTPKPFLRPLPVRPQPQHGDDSVIVPRRMSSLQPSPSPAQPVAANVDRSFTAPARPPSTGSNSQLDSSKIVHATQPLRRPTSLQVRSDHAPFLSSSRPVAAPVRAVSSTPSFVPGKRSSVLHQSPSNPALRQLSSQTMAPRNLAPRRSMPVIGLPPPAPPPNMPLPPPPPVSAPRSIAVGMP